MDCPIQSMSLPSMENSRASKAPISPVSTVIAKICPRRPSPHCHRKGNRLARELAPDLGRIGIDPVLEPPQQVCHSAQRPMITRRNQR